MRKRLTLHLAEITAAIALLDLDRDDPNAAAELRALERAAERLAEECEQTPTAA